MSDPVLDAVADLDVDCNKTPGTLDFDTAAARLCALYAHAKEEGRREGMREAAQKAKSIHGEAGCYHAILAAMEADRKSASLLRAHVLGPRTLEGK